MSKWVNQVAPWNNDMIEKSHKMYNPDQEKRDVECKLGALYSALRRTLGISRMGRCASPMRNQNRSRSPSPNRTMNSTLNSSAIDVDPEVVRFVTVTSRFDKGSATFETGARNFQKSRPEPARTFADSWFWLPVLFILSYLYRLIDLLCNIAAKVGCDKSQTSISLD